MKAIVVIVLIAVPIVIALVMQFRLSEYRRDGGAGPIAAFRALRPDQYTEEGQLLLRWSWAVLVLTIPWWLVVIGLLGWP